MQTVGAAPGEAALTAVIVAVGLLTLLALAFAAVTVALRIRNDRAARRWQRLESAWQPLILDVLVGARSAESLHAAVLPPDRLPFLEYLVRFARRFRGEEFALVAALAEPYLPLLAPRARHRKPEVRARAIQTLATLRLALYEGEVIAALDDPEILVAMAAARALARKEHPHYAARVLEHLDRFDSLAPRFLAALLAGMGTSAAPALRATLGDAERPPRVRAVAAEALAYLRDPAAGDLAAEVVSAAQDVDLLAAALRLLTRVGTSAHAEPVRKAAHSADERVRAGALRALGRIGEPIDVPVLRSALEDAAPWAALRAAYALAEMGAQDELRAALREGRGRSDILREVLESPAPA